MQSRDESVRLISFVSGFSASVLLGYPFDTLKILTQTKSKKSPHQTLLKPTSNPFIKLRRLYRGVTAPLLTVGFFTAINFSVYENARLSLLSYIDPENNKNISFKQNLLCVYLGGIISGSTIAFISTPFENLKVVQQTQKKKSSLNWMKKLFKSNSLYRGFLANWICQSIGRGFYLSANYTTTETFKQHKDTLRVKLLAASSAGFCGWVFTFPFDVTRSNLMSDYKKIKYKNTKEFFNKTYTKEGIKGFYKGLGFTLMRAIPVACVTLPTYDYMQRFLLKLLHSD
eukprot:snap_masked-scaffold_9-processed-gene-13.74-mRNA-1 protein AED:1.00 eAED:1.00 QI:0/0/0/0/1/1/2/0/284